MNGLDTTTQSSPAWAHSLDHQHYVWTLCITNLLFIMSLTLGLNLRTAVQSRSSKALELPEVPLEALGGDPCSLKVQRQG